MFCDKTYVLLTISYDNDKRIRIENENVAVK
jgi:hypothetical protein